MSPMQAPVVKCPACGGKSLFAPNNAWRPFCSQRCKQSDLGAWASESFRVAGQLDDLDPSEAIDLVQQSKTLH
ncbi:MAG: DNA gyrase inhibitor YacG [Brachymonas sp.]